MDTLKDSVLGAIKELRRGSLVVNFFDMFTVYTGERKEAKQYSDMFFDRDRTDEIVNGSPGVSKYAIWIPKTFILLNSDKELLYTIGHEIFHVLYNLHQGSNQPPYRFKFNRMTIESWADLYGCILSGVQEKGELITFWQTTLKIMGANQRDLEDWIIFGECAQRMEFCMKALTLKDKWCLAQTKDNVMNHMFVAFEQIKDVGLANME
jgi:hypothetical protein